MFKNPPTSRHPKTRQGRMRRGGGSDEVRVYVCALRVNASDVRLIE